jgi:hypothetical protein
MFKCPGLLAATGAIALLSSPLSATAQTPAPAVERDNTLCRAANRDTPIFENGDTLSRALEIVKANDRVTLVGLPPAGSQFAAIRAPRSGFIQTGILKQCTTTTPPDEAWNKIPTTGTVCRRAIRPAALNVRSAPVFDPNNRNVITSFNNPRTVFVTTTTGNVVKSYRNDDFIWVQVDLRRTFGSTLGSGLDYGWIYNTDLLNNPNQSNLVFCQ